MESIDSITVHLFMRQIFQKIWELLLPIPMPWQVVLVLLLVIPLIPLLVLRCFPWLITRLLQLVLFSTKLIAYSLCFLEYQITQVIRRSKRKPPIILYILSDILASSVRFCESLEVSAKHLSNKAFRVPWVLRTKGWYALPLTLIPVWFIRPYLGNSIFSTSIDNGVSWWCSLEHWIMAGEWKASNLTCRYPYFSPRWDTFLKAREYEVKREIQKYTGEIEKYSQNPIAYYNRGRAYLSIENIEAAFKDYTASLRINSAYEPSHVGRGDIYFLKGDKDRAFREYSNAIYANPKYAPGYVGRGNVYLVMNDNSSAFKEFSIATNLDPKYASGYIGRGDVYQRRGDKETALQEYKKAIQIDSNNALAYARIGNLYHRNFDNREAAIDEYERASKLFLKNGQIDSYQKVVSILDELNRYTTHTVSHGDSLSKIAQRYGVSIQVIVSANKETYPSLVTNPDTIEVGWRLKIPQ